MFCVRLGERDGELGMWRSFVFMRKVCGRGMEWSDIVPR